MTQEYLKETFSSRDISLKEDYPILAEWWKSYKKWRPVNKLLLPDIGTAVTWNENLAAAGFLYTTNSKIAWIEWVVADPSLDKNTRKNAVIEVLEALTKKAKAAGAAVIYTNIDQNFESYKTTLKENGFMEAERNSMNLWKGAN